jgi:hypothetical protein
MYYTHDTVSMGIDDPADQLLWLENVLENAEKQNEKVDFDSLSYLDCFISC